MTIKAPEGARAMIRWYSPRLLLRTGFRAAIATTIGQLADNREIQAAFDDAGKDAKTAVADYASGRNGDFWLDYVADFGDGYQPTWAVARLLVEPVLAHDGEPTRRGEVLVIGGDAVYPDPSPDAYETCSIAPYKAACSAVDEFTADVFALPGNHDWYDGLNAFSGVFISSAHDYAAADQGRFANWRTRQSRSYFALRLPHDWWLFGIDIQLDRRLNVSQLDYFQRIARDLMSKGDKVILCAAVPSWVIDKVRHENAAANLVRIAEVFANAGGEVRLVLTGDLHHFSHYHSEHGSGPHLITAGGGGAFLHPTHKLPDAVEIPWRDRPAERFRLDTCYPDKKTSRRLSWRNLGFAINNWDFALAIAAVYMLLSWFLETRLLDPTRTLADAYATMLSAHDTIANSLVRLITTIPKSPEFAIVVFAVALALIAFNVGMSMGKKIVLGIAHTACHFVAFVMTFCLAIQLARLVASAGASGLASFTVFMGAHALIGAALSGLVFGLYLLFSLNGLGLQWTNAFSALRIADYKNFVRLRIDADGALSVYPFALDEVSSSPRGARAIRPALTIT